MGVVQVRGIRMSVDLKLTSRLVGYRVVLPRPNSRTGHLTSRARKEAGFREFRGIPEVSEGFRGIPGFVRPSTRRTRFLTGAAREVRQFPNTL